MEVVIRCVRGSNKVVADIYMNRDAPGSDGTIGNIKNLTGGATTPFNGNRSYSDIYELTSIGSTPLTQTYNLDGQVATTHSGIDLDWDASGRLKEVDVDQNATAVGARCLQFNRSHDFQLKHEGFDIYLTQFVPISVLLAVCLYFSWKTSEPHLISFLRFSVTFAYVAVILFVSVLLLSSTFSVLSGLSESILYNSTCGGR